MSYNYLALITIMVCMVTGCEHDVKSAPQKSKVESLNKQDSVLFIMRDKNFRATLSVTNTGGRGSANGPRLFQRRGSLRFVLGELYGDNPINLQNNPYQRKKYKVDIQWNTKVDINRVRQKVLSKIKETLNYQTTRKSTKIMVYHLMISDNTKLKQAIDKSSLSGGVDYKSTINNGRWNIIATLPTFAAKLSEKLNERIIAKQKELRTFYHFKLNLHKDKVDLEQQLKDEYGLVLKRERKSVKRINIAFDNS